MADEKPKSDYLGMAQVMRELRERAEQSRLVRRKYLRNAGIGVASALALCAVLIWLSVLASAW